MEYKSPLLQIVFNGHSGTSESPQDIIKQSINMEKENNYFKINSVNEEIIEEVFAPPLGMRWDEYGNPELVDFD